MSTPTTPLSEATARERANEILGSDYEWPEMPDAIARAILRAFNEGARLSLGKASSSVEEIARLIEEHVEIVRVNGQEAMMGALDAAQAIASFSPRAAEMSGSAASVEEIAKALRCGGLQADHLIRDLAASGLVIVPLTRPEEAPDGR